MSTFVAFRSAVISVLQPPTVLRPIPTLAHARYLHHVTTNAPNFNPNAAKRPQWVLKKQPTEQPQTKDSEKKKGPIKDEDIRAQFVQINYNGRLSRPTPVSRLLSLLDRRGYYILLVSANPPIVRIINKTEEFERKKQEQEQAKLARTKQVHKEMQLTWGAAEADMAHKLGKVREELERGHRVDLVFTVKKGQRGMPVREVRAKVQEVVSTFEDVAKVYKEGIFQSRMAAVFLQGVKDTQSSLELQGEGAAEQKEEEGKKQKKESKHRALQRQQAEQNKAPGKPDKYKIEPIPQAIWDLFQ